MVDNSKVTTRPRQAFCNRPNVARHHAWRGALGDCWAPPPKRRTCHSHLHPITGVTEGSTGGQCHAPIPIDIWNRRCTGWSYVLKVYKCSHQGKLGSSTSSPITSVQEHSSGVKTIICNSEGCDRLLPSQTWWTRSNNVVSEVERNGILYTWHLKILKISYQRCGRTCWINYLFIFLCSVTPRYPVFSQQEIHCRPLTTWHMAPSRLALQHARSSSCSCTARPALQHNHGELDGMMQKVKSLTPYEPFNFM